ncbi:Dam family site-specific DNA-(adenine-N6)-methyltransferase [Magnetospirillum sp. UT-4]|uniref:DNA adenine methylase n=1 Tax=Magnetospirillum sp. UT-4 TaxID=2681467 RepID=UPI00137ED3EB|nr:Dam family site-specific DNA-(adenine-N6)-methyltransferase [Magnetospirillum sp. UT-4]CAA7616941.1 DNA adenine methylase Dam [Magnetospirillum sp. UT-4]
MNMPIAPIIKWVGGKRALLPHLLPRVPPGFRTYHEPFLGGGALFCALRPRFAYLADANPELVALYRAVKARPQALMRRMAEFACDKAEYYRVRDLDRDPAFATLPELERAARFLYINKTCFNGLWRVNRQGRANNAWGKRVNPTFYDADNLLALHEALRTARLARAPFTDVLSLARPGDFVYFDPPYDSEGRGAVRYTWDGFGRDDQRRLWEVCVKLHRMGVRWMLSNADTGFIRRLFRQFRIEGLAAPRRLSGDPAARRDAAEVVVRNY